MRPLLIAEACNPEWVSVPLVGWNIAKALKCLLPDSHLVSQIRNKDAILNTEWQENVDFTAIDSEAVARLMWKISSLLRGGKGKGWTTITAFNLPSYLYFEHILWKQFESRLKNDTFDLVHRITPLTPTSPSPIAKKCAKFDIPFVWGPINGGVPWPKEFERERRKEKEWLSYVRDAYKFIPGYQSTRENASAIIVGSLDTLKQMPERYHEKCVYIPENAVDITLFNEPIDRDEIELPLRIAFLGRLVPYKGADILLEAAAALIRQGKINVDIIGDGPEMKHLQEYVRQEKLEDGVQFAGWVNHSEVQQRLKNSDVLGFPSIREFGGGVVLEAMALGLVPIIVDYAGPSELVTETTGFKIPLLNRDGIVAGFRNTLEELCNNSSKLRFIGMSARKRVLEKYTWHAKSMQILEVYRWALNEIDNKPIFDYQVDKI